jgi:hypothetical protein
MLYVKYFLLLIFFFAGCSSEQPTDIVNRESLNYLYQDWQRSYEEETDSVKIFRPSESRTFPPGYYRENLEFYSNGELKYLYLSPSDAHHFKYGSWEAFNDDDMIRINYSRDKVQLIRIVELDKDIFRFTLVAESK